MNDLQHNGRKILFCLTQSDFDLLHELTPLLQNKIGQLMTRLQQRLLSHPQTIPIAKNLPAMQTWEAWLQDHLAHLITGQTSLEAHLQMVDLLQRLHIPLWCHLVALDTLRTLLKEELANIDHKETAQLALEKIWLFEAHLLYEVGIHSSHAEEVQQDLHSSNHCEITSESTYQELLKKMLSQAKRYAEPLTSAALALHKNADQSSPFEEHLWALTQQSLQETLRNEDVISNITQDTFLLFLPKTAEEQALKLIRRLIKTFKAKTENRHFFCMSLVQTGPKLFLPQEELLINLHSGLKTAQTHAQRSPGFYIQRHEQSI
ncbi:MAG: protoglobin domain-containing protein [Magnetococcus sp. DMHC-6]